jgi:hypothetical protein
VACTSIAGILVVDLRWLASRLVLVDDTEAGLSFKGCSLYEGEAAVTGAVEAPGGWLVACNYQPMARCRRRNRVTKSTGLVSISAMLSADLQAIILIRPDGFEGE